jgi:hypothetical protein
MDVTQSKGQIAGMLLVAGPKHAHRWTMTPDHPSKIVTDTTPRPTWRRVVIWIFGFVVCVAVLHFFLSWSLNYVSEINTISGSMTMVGVIVISLIIYAVLIATPFMPGIEVGIALLMLQGAQIAPFVYAATVIGLFTAYLIGRWIPIAWLHRLLCDLGLSKLCSFLDTIETTPAEDRMATQRAILPAWLAKLTIDYRYVTLGLLLNLPGTFALGGGGGILMAAGLSRLFHGWVILATLLIATLPVPLVVWVMGVTVVKDW